MDDEKLALVELKRDLLFEKIPITMYEYYVKQSMKIGIDAAEKLERKSLSEIYKEYNIKISYNKKTNILMNFQLRAEFIKGRGQDEVVIYTDTLDELKNCLNHSEYIKEEITLSELIDLHLAHELCHFLEYENNFPIEKRLEPVKVKTLFGRHKMMYIKQCSEIACHTFAKKITNFPYFPTLLDVIFLESKGELDSDIKKDVLFNVKNNKKDVRKCLM
ncbi:hypothetical protein [Marinilactibacillus psychrotolerans]|uniref:ImmA/IrrE family metallo-endopeptidase n=1 Tax=Marinilactibacillus psychrotolerans TaxID=191770 RepID=A0ABW8UH38_9LACT